MTKNPKELYTEETIKNLLAKLQPVPKQLDDIKLNNTLENKILTDFHGNAPIINKEYDGELPKVSVNAQLYIKSILKENQHFRLAVNGGGCSGFEYGFYQEESIKKDEDIIICEDPTIIVDTISIKYLWGSTLNCVQETFGIYLKVVNPGVKQSCGCGVSFSFPEI